ncbi:hypothetical protein EII17_04740 [Clostridiales bacterium COT073_COT-073]|nr:hypothetical protein EII17_04740 [Clostridiales bacterium COT073_COT-073]
MTFFLIITALAFGMLISLPETPMFFLSICLSLSFLAVSAYNTYHSKKISNQIIWAAYLLAIILFYQTLKQIWPAFYYGLSRLSLGLSGLTGWLIDKPIAMNITYSGIDLVFLFVVAFLLLCLLFQEKRISVLISYLLLSLFLWLVYPAVWTVLAENSLSLRLHLLEPLTGPLDYRLLLFALLLLLYHYFTRKILRIHSQPDLALKIKYFSAAALSVSLLFSFFSTSVAQNPESDKSQVVFWDTGIDFSLPTYERYGLDQVGMFGALPHYLKRQGYESFRAKKLTTETLQSAKVLVILNPGRTPEPAELTAIWQFTENGGSVLLAGDHTCQEQIRWPINEILKPVGIELNFDSAVPFKELWGGQYQQASAPVLKGIQHEQLQIVVGASLTAGPRVKPLIIGREGFSDAGDLTNPENGYLGNMHFNRGETIGDMLLAAEATYGRGTFMAFADTSPFQNTVLAYSYPLIDNIFAYLSQSQATAAIDNSISQLLPAAESNAFPASAIIDLAYLPSIARDKSLNSVDGFVAATMRAGMMPYFNYSDTLANALARQPDNKLLLLIEPALELSAKDLAAIDQFLMSGGNLILCVGYESPAAAQKLAKHFGFGFSQIPLGRIAPDKNPTMASWNACPLLYQGQPIGHSGEVVSLLELWDYSIIARQNIGQGQLYLLADPDFLKNKNLEHVDSYREGNVVFVNTILAEIGKGEK